MNQEPNSEAAETVQTREIPAVELPQLVRLLPCPFCGSAAKTYCETVTCSNPSCKMHFGCVPDMHTPEEWGQRACDTCDAVDLANEQLRKDVVKLVNSRNWNKRRLDLLASVQKHMRDPERQLVCDILANGQLLPDPHGTRYGFPASGNEHLSLPNASVDLPPRSGPNSKQDAYGG